MKRILILGLLAIGLLGAIIFLKKEKEKNPKTTYDVSASKFAVPAIEEVQRIFIADKEGRFVNLKKNADEWRLNDTYRADPNTMNLLLKAIEKLDIQYIPPAASSGNIIKNIAVFGISVELFGNGDKQLRKYYVGGMTQDERGTYFLMDQATQPYALEVPGFAGNIRERFKPELNRFRSQKFLQFDQKKVSQINAYYPTQDESSFFLQRKALKDKIQIGPNVSESKVENANSVKVDAYLTALNLIACESYLNSDPRKDSIFLTTPFCEIEIQMDDGEPIELQFWTKEKNVQAAQIGARYFIRKDDEFLLAQFQVIKPAFRDGRFFLQ